MRAIVYAIIFFSFFDLFTQLPIITPLAGSVGATPFLTGLAVGMYSLSNMIGNVASGFLTDKKGPFRLLMAGLLLTGGSLLLYHLAANAYILLIVRFIHGCTAGLIMPAAFTFIANTSENNKKGKHAAISGAFIGVAAITGPAFSGILASRTSEVTVFTVTAACMFLLGALAFIFLRTAHLSPKSSVRQTERPVRELFKTPSVVKAFSGAFFLMFSQGVLAYMLPLKVAELGSDTKTSGMLLSTFGIIAVLIFILPTNRLFDRIKPIRLLVFGMSLMGVSLLLISMGGSLSILYLFMALYGTGFAFLFPSINTLLIESTTDQNRGKAYGYFYAFFSIGVVAGSSITGMLQLTANGGFVFTGCLLLIIAILLLIVKGSIELRKNA
ncbi:MFS family permease [Bacillus thermophilus]|uniref:MFS family permease n=1 Tax=Siminovitchia thermophila TaxID=1245522 RepID=A0ABS2RA07_9BACI|nr:MFS transporter [Siminovitchia thermophila]MBM7716210.1 MFS family permease [Siminovitchia thermophila]ONK21447.1 MFS transporter [Bacillus sp. VT-16-64]